MKNFEIVKEIRLHFNTDIIVLWNEKEKTFDYYFKDVFMKNFDFSFGCADLFSNEHLQNMEYNGYFISELPFH